MRCWASSTSEQEQQTVAEALEAAPCEPTSCRTACRLDHRCTGAFEPRLCACRPRRAGSAFAKPRSIQVQGVPPGALAFFRGLPDSAEPPDAAAIAASQMARIPARIDATLLGFQRRGVEQILRWGGRGLLADEMGLGKTVQAQLSLAHCSRGPFCSLCPRRFD